ncbi:MAG: hypothetical protein VW338_09200 [Rhodospirillaceae bacterium]
MVDEAAPVNAGDEAQVKGRKSKARRQREAELAALASILSTKGGRRFVWRLLEEAKIHSTSFAVEATITAFNEGKRHVGLWALAEVFEADPSAYTRMRQEASE